MGNQSGRGFGQEGGGGWRRRGTQQANSAGFVEEDWEGRGEDHGLGFRVLGFRGKE
jgi:hypothetical protein